MTACEDGTMKYCVTGFVPKLGLVCHVIKSSSPDEAWLHFADAHPNGAEKMEIRKMLLKEGEKEKRFFVSPKFWEMKRKYGCAA